MIINLLVVAFVLGMAYWWSSQGLFSALLHLAMVVAAGAMALALWEPAAYTLLGLPDAIADHVRHFAWGLGLLLPFALILAILRGLSDRFIPGNVHVHGLVSQLVGGALGLVSGILTAGLAIIGLNFLGGAPALAGYQPYIISGSGEVERNPDGGGLWLPVDTWAGGFYARLSQAGLGDGLMHRTPLATHRPELARQAAVFTLRYDDHASIVAGPEAVRLGQTRGVPTRQRDELDLSEAIQEALGAELQNEDNRLIVADTIWSDRAGAYDLDATLRVPPTQVRLLTHAQGRGGEARWHAPRAFTRFRSDNGEREFHAIDTADSFASSTSPEQGLGWVFLVPADRDPTALHVRELRYPIDRVVEEAGEVARMLGTAPAVEPDEEDPEEEPAEVREIDEDDVPEIRLTNDLPRPISVNESNRLSYGEDNVVRYGRDESTRSPTRAPETTAEAVAQPGHMVIVRLAIQGDRARSLLGRARAAAAAVQGVHLLDDRGATHWPIGYVWERGNRSLQLNFPRGEYLRQATQLPVNEMDDDDTLYLYFRIGRDQNVTITGYQVGDQRRTGLSVAVE